jgi:DNA mismatch endonuclease (patch repair protein)
MPVLDALGIPPNFVSMDRLTPDERSANMGRIKGRDTGPERIVRKALHALGYRFRLNRRDLPGTPDIVLPRLKTAIFVHGCFWHRHEGCKYCYSPKTNADFWNRKFINNLHRDKRAHDDLERMDWKVIVIWECETVDRPGLSSRLSAYLKS